MIIQVSNKRKLEEAIADATESVAKIAKSIVSSYKQQKLYFVKLSISKLSIKAKNKSKLKKKSLTKKEKKAKLNRKSKKNDLSKNEASNDVINQRERLRKKFKKKFKPLIQTVLIKNTLNMLTNDKLRCKDIKKNFLAN